MLEVRNVTDFNDAICESKLTPESGSMTEDDDQKNRAQVQAQEVQVQDTAVLDVHPLEWDSPEKLKLLIEGAIFASQEPISQKSLQMLFPEWARPNLQEIEGVLHELECEYAERAVHLHQSTLGYRFQVRQAATPLVRSMLTDKPPKYSRAFLETLALIAYRQPMTRGEIEEVRGVSVSSHIIRSMEERGWIRVVGHKEVPGRPALWATTPDFLAYFGLQSLEDLPPLAELQSLESEKLESEKINDIIDSSEATEVADKVKAEQKIICSEAENSEDIAIDAELERQGESQTTMSNEAKLEEVDYQSLFDRLRNMDEIT